MEGEDGGNTGLTGGEDGGNTQEFERKFLGA